MWYALINWMWYHIYGNRNRLWHYCLTDFTDTLCKKKRKLHRACYENYTVMGFPRICRSHFSFFFSLSACLHCQLCLRIRKSRFCIPDFLIVITCPSACQIANDISYLTLTSKQRLYSLFGLESKYINMSKRGVSKRTIRYKPESKWNN